MIHIEPRDSTLILVYIGEQQGASWLDKKLSNGGGHTFYNTFTVSQRNSIKAGTKGPYDDNQDVRHFVIGKKEKEYWKIDKNILGLKHDLLLSQSIHITKKTFVAHTDISIFARIDSLVEEQIVVGGNHPEAIPKNEFDNLLKSFPTSTELRRYADSRLAQMLNEYFKTMTDAEQKLAEHFKRRRSRTQNNTRKSRASIKLASELDLEKYAFVRDQLESMLVNQEAFSEDEWQKVVIDIFLLIFPQYIAALEDVSVKEYYSSPPKATTRKFDITLVSANGHVDLIEIKKPQDLGMLSQNVYRNNHYPLKDLSGAIMQAEKYIFYLNKAGIEAERNITKKYSAQLPKSLEIKVSNPKSIILCGRDHKFTPQQKFDFEFIKRKYSNVIDIITYDDLLRRLDNLIEMLKKRT